MQPLKHYLDLLLKSLNSTTKEQAEVVADISRRGFLKTIVEIVAFGAFASTCCKASDDDAMVLPDMGDIDQTNLTRSEADFLGQSVLQDVANSGSMVDDYDTLAYLNSLGNDLSSYSALAGQNFNFYLIKDKIINAFALPGGYICVYNGLIYTTQTEAELVSVMAHEIAHVVQHHIFRNIAGYKRNQWVALAGILSGAMLAAANPALGSAAINSGQGLAMQNMLANSRDFEREADRLGQRLMYLAGFDPHAMPEFFEKLKNTTKFNDKEAFAFLRTHPVTSERIHEAQTRANHLQVKMRPDSPSFLLIREKCRIRQIGVNEALKFYESALIAKKYISQEAQYYGLSLANFANKRADLSLDWLARIKAHEFANHPAVLSLKGLSQSAARKYKDALKTYSYALEEYPHYKGLWLGQIDMYIDMKNYFMADKSLTNLTLIYPNDIDIWHKMALLYSDSKMNNQQKYHYALGSRDFLLGNFNGALTQYQLALLGKDARLNAVISAKILTARAKLRESKQSSN